MTGSSAPSPSASDGLHRLPRSVRLTAALFLGVLGLAYAAFLAQIGFDTEMRITLITEAYRDMDGMEYAAHCFRYLGWFAMTFASVVGLFLFSRRSERMKRFFAVWTPAWIVVDLASTWLIRFSDVFAYALFVSGFALAATFAVLFVLIQAELWP